MTLLTQRPSVSELSLRVLDMAKTGVYRESVFEALQPLATQKQIRLAIAHAKKFGLHSVASLRDAELGTYYQVDQAIYQARKQAIHQVPDSDRDSDRDGAVITVDTVCRVLVITSAIARGVASILLILGIVAGVSGQRALGFGLMVGAACTFSHMFLQRCLAQKLLGIQL
ncbi:MAG: hypothetical protein ACFB8W_07515 [Elainellaceae cyanobacterium]